LLKTAINIDDDTMYYAQLQKITINFSEKYTFLAEQMDPENSIMPLNAKVDCCWHMLLICTIL